MRGLGTEKSLERNVLFAVELLDAVTLEPLNAGIHVEARGLRGTPITSASRRFVWLKEDISTLQSISIDTGDQPYQGLDLDPTQIQVPLTTVHMAPRVNYPFQAGVSGVRGVLVESRTGPAQPVLDADIHFRWLDDHGRWQDAAPRSRTAADKGAFVAILRLLPGDLPDLDTAGAISVQLRVARPSGPPRSASLPKLTPGRLLGPVTFAWDELQL